MANIVRYNSAFYSSLATNDYDIYVVSQDFLSGANATWANYGLVSAETLQQDIATNNTVKFKRLDALSCIKAYGQVFLQDYRNLVIVSTNSSSDTSSVLQADVYYFAKAVDLPVQTYKPFDWICTSDSNMDTKVLVPGNQNDGDPASCDAYLNRVESIADEWQPYGYDLDYCLAEYVEQQCSFNGNIPIVITVIVCNTIKVVLMLMVAFRLKGGPLITVGDALESFLETPDANTKDLCLFTRRDAEWCERHAYQRLKNGQPLWIYSDRTKPKSAKLATLRWSKAASGRRWTVTIVLIIWHYSQSVGFWRLQILTIVGRVTSLMGLGFGTVHASAILSGWSIDNIENPALQIVAAIFVANSPQAILSFLYLNLNGLLTSMWVALEWSQIRQRA